jgi:hypothetical protein
VAGAGRRTRLVTPSRSARLVIDFACPLSIRRRQRWTPTSDLTSVSSRRGRSARRDEGARPDGGPDWCWRENAQDQQRGWQGPSQNIAPAITTPIGPACAARGIGHRCLSKLAAGGLLALSFRFLNWRAWHRAVGAEDTAISLFGSQQLRAPLAVIEELARVGGHRLGLLVSAVWAGDGGLQIDHADRLFQSAKTVRPRNKTSAGNST